MNYKKLINEYTRNQKYLVIVLLAFIAVVSIGILIVHKMTLRSLIVMSSVCIFLIGLYFFRKKQFNDIYKSLSKEEQKELDLDINQTYFFSGRDYALSSKYIINFKNPKIIKYDSILIIDKTHKLSPHHNTQSVMCDMVYIFTKESKIGLIIKEYRIINSKEQYYEGLYSYIKAQNPNVLEGYTKANRKIINKKHNIKI